MSRFPAAATAVAQNAQGVDNRRMEELVRTNDVVLISVIESLLSGAEIGHLVLDEHMSVLEGSLGIIQRRVLVESDSAVRARRLLVDAGLGHELRPA